MTPTLPPLPDTDWGVNATWKYTDAQMHAYAAQAVAAERERCAILAASAAAHAQCGDWLDACKALDRLKAGASA